MYNNLAGRISQEFIKIISAHKVFNFSYMKNFYWVTMFRKFNVYTFVVKPRRMNFSRTLQLPTFIGSCWFSYDRLLLTNNLLENFSWVNSNPLLCRFLRLQSTFCLCFLHLNLTITRSSAIGIKMESGLILANFCVSYLYAIPSLRNHLPFRGVQA